MQAARTRMPYKASQCQHNLLLFLQADKDEARSQHAAALSELEALSQQLATASTAKSQAESAAEELQATHDALVAQHAALQTQVGRAFNTAQPARSSWCCQPLHLELTVLKMLGLCTLWLMRMHEQNGMSMLTACTHCMRAACTLPRCPRLVQLREAEDASEKAAAKAEGLSAALEASEEALSEARSLTAQQASRLSHLESEFEALQVRRSGCVRVGVTVP